MCQFKKLQSWCHAEPNMMLLDVCHYQIMYKRLNVYILSTTITNPYNTNLVDAQISTAQVLFKGQLHEQKTEPHLDTLLSLNVVCDDRMTQTDRITQHHVSLTGYTDNLT